MLIAGLDDKRACAAMAAAMGSSCDVSGAAHLPDHVASWFDGLPRPEASTVLRLEGFAPSVAYRSKALAALMKSFRIGGAARRKEFARALAQHPQRQAFAADATRPGRCGEFPRARRGHHIAAAITPAAQMFYDWAGGLVWVAMPLADQPTQPQYAPRCAVGGHATLVRAPAAVRATADVFAPGRPGPTRSPSG